MWAAPALTRGRPRAWKGDGEEGDDDDDEDEEDPVEEFIKSLPEPVQKCVSALDELDVEVCELEAKFRKEMRELERKVRACASCHRAVLAMRPGC